MITLQDSLSFEKISDFSGHNSAIYSLAYQHLTDFFYSVGGDGWIVKWPLKGVDTNGKLIGETGSKLFSSAMIDKKNLLVTGDIDGNLFWLDVSKNVILGRSAFHKGSIFDICVVNESRLITVSGDGYLCLWDTDSRFPLLSKRISFQGLRCIVYDQFSDRIYVGASDNNLYVLDNSDFKEIFIIRKAHNNSIFSLQLMSNHYLISGGRDAHIRIWNLKDFTENADLPAHWYTVNKILHIPELNIIVTASRDKTIRIWDDNNYALIKTLDVQKGGHFNSVNTLLWIREDRILLSAGDDRIIRKWLLKDVVV